MAHERTLPAQTPPNPTSSEIKTDVDDLIRKEKKLGKAVASLKQEMKIDAEDLKNRIASLNKQVRYLQLEREGDTLAKENKKKEAIAKYKTAIEEYAGLNVLNKCAELYMITTQDNGKRNTEEGLKLLDLAVQQESAEAMNSRAYHHLFGIGCPVNYPEAIRLFDRAISLGDVSAIRNRAWMHLNGKGGPVDYEKAIQLLEIGITKKSTYAMLMRAKLYESGQGGPINRTAALILYKQAALADNRRAKAIVAASLTLGLHGETNLTRAEELILQAIQEGLNCAKIFKFLRYLTVYDGFPTLREEKFDSAIEELEKAIQAEDKILEIKSEREKGVQSYRVKKNRILYDVAPREIDFFVDLQTHLTGLFYQGYMHEIGYGRPVDLHEAARLYDLIIANDMHDRFATVQRAAMLEKGLAGDVNVEMAVKLYKDACDITAILDMLKNPQNLRTQSPLLATFEHGLVHDLNLKQISSCEAYHINPTLFTIYAFKLAEDKTLSAFQKLQLMHTLVTLHPDLDIQAKAHGAINLATAPVEKTLDHVPVENALAEEKFTLNNRGLTIFFKPEKKPVNTVTDEEVVELDRDRTHSILSKFFKLADEGECDRHKKSKEFELQDASHFTKQVPE